MPLINCEIIFQSKWSKDFYQVAGTAANQTPEIKTTDAILYVAVVTISTQDNIKLLKQLESGFKRTIIGININLKQQIKRKTDI